MQRAGRTGCASRAAALSPPLSHRAAGGYIHITPLQVYDELLAAALSATGCGARALNLEGAWRWLLDEFGSTYGVRSHSAQVRVCG